MIGGVAEHIIHIKNRGSDHGETFIPALFAVPITHFANASNDSPDRRSSCITCHFSLFSSGCGGAREVAHTLLDLCNLVDML